MSYIKTQSIIDYFADSGIHVFTLNEVARLTKKKKSYLSMLLPTNPRIKRVERGKYFTAGADSYEIASNIAYPSYISLMSALRYYNLTTQELVRVNVITPLRHRAIKLGNFRINFTTLSPKRIFGYRKFGRIMMASVEKAIVDCLYLREPPYSDVEEAFEKAVSEELIDLNKLKRYAIAMNSGALISRLGFLLESAGINSDDLIKYKSKRSVVLFGNGSKKDRKWSVLYD